MIYGREPVQNCTSRRRVRFENFKTSRATKNLEMHELVHDIFVYYIFNNRISAWNTCNILSSFSYLLIFWLTFRSIAQFCQTSNQVYVAFKVFWVLEFSSSCSTSLWFSNLALAIVPIATSVQHSITLQCTLITALSSCYHWAKKIEFGATIVQCIDCESKLGPRILLKTKFTCCLSRWEYQKHTQ